MENYTLHPPAQRVSWLENALQDIELLLEIRITLHDLSKVFVGTDGRGLLDRWRSSHRRYSTCASGYCRRCLQECYQVVNKQAATGMGAFTHQCWKGFVELVVPLRRDGVHVATLFAGQWRPRHMQVSHLLDRRTVHEIRGLPPIDDQRQRSLGVILETFAAGLLAQTDELRHINRPLASRKEAIFRFMELHAAKPIGLGNLAAALHLSPSRTSHLVRQLTGHSFQALLIEERLRKARALLRSTDLTVAEIAHLVGIDNECYFSRLFRSREGIPPGVYRRQGPTVASRPDIADQPGNAGT